MAKKTKKPAAKKTAKKATKKTATKKKTAAKKPAKKATKKKAVKKAKATKTATKKTAAKTTTKKKTTRKPNAAFMKALTPSPALAAVIGSKPLPRTQVIKNLWTYIKKNNLQNPKNKRNIMADAKLKPVFGKNEVSMFQLAGILNGHLK